jgi:Holliday junction resolvase-like predicted endonuclease
MSSSRIFGDEAERLARVYLKKRFPDLEVSPRGFDRSLGPADFVVKNPNNNRIRALVQVKSGLRSARVTAEECKRLIKQANFLGGTPYILMRVGPLRGGTDVYWNLETAHHALRFMGRSKDLVDSGYNEY